MESRLDKVIKQIETDTFLGKVINLSGEGIGDEGAKKLARALKDKNLNLEGINLDENKIGDEGAVKLAEVFAGMKELKLVEMGMNKIGSNGASALMTNGSFRSLDLRGNSMEDGEIKAPSARHFDRLNLSDCRLTSKIIRSIQATVKSLNLSNNELNDDVFECINVSGLREINLTQNEITFEAEKSIADFLKRHNDELKIINLKNNLIGDEGAGVCFKLLKNSKVEQLDLSWNQIESWVKAGALKELCCNLNLEHNPISPAPIMHFSGTTKDKKITTNVSLEARIEEKEGAIVNKIIRKR